MARYKIVDPEGKSWNVEGEGSQRDALAHFQSQWKSGGQPAPGVLDTLKASLPQNAEQASNMARTTSNAAGIAGLLLPLGEAAASGTLLPAAAGLAGAAGVGYGAKKLMDAAGTTDMLNRGADALRAGTHDYQESDVNHPIIGGTAANMIANLGGTNGLRRLGANALTAVPDSAAMLAGAAAGGPIAEGAQGIGQLLWGSPKVPLTESGNAVLGALDKTYGTNSPKVKDTGEFRAAMDANRSTLGAPVEAAKEAAYDSATMPKNFSGFVNQAIGKGLVEGGNAKGAMGKFEPIFSKNPQASKDVLATAQEATPGMNSMEKARAIQGQFAQTAADLRKPLNAPPGTKVKSPAADIYSNVAGSIDEALKSLMTDEGRQGLEAANNKFSPFAKAHEFFQKANAGGDFSAAKSKALWDTLKPAERAKMDPQGHLAKIMDTGNPGLITKLAEGIGSVAKIPLKTVGLGRLANGIESLITSSPKNAFRFNAPAVAPQVPAAAGGIAGAYGAALGGNRFPSAY